MKLPDVLKDLPQHELEGKEYFSTADLIDVLGLSKSTFYARLKELEFQPRRIKQKTYLLVKEAVELVHYVDYLSRGGNLQGWKEKQSALSTQVEQAEITPTQEPEPETIDIETLRHLSEAAKEGWWLPTNTLAKWLGVSPSSIARQGQKFIAFGFEFERTEHRWKGSIQWSVRLVRNK
jgi:hypothetical protein